MVKRLYGSIEERVEHQLKRGAFTPEQLKTILRYKNEHLANGGSLKTISGNLYFLEKISKIVPKPYEEYTKDDFMKILEELGNNGTKYYHKKIRQFWRWLNEGELPKSCRWIDPRKKKADRKEDKKILTDAQKKKMLEIAGTQRDRTILMLMMDTGARPGEIAALRVKDIVPVENGMICRISKGKTGERTRLLYDSVPDVQLYLNTHPRKNEPNAPLFFSVGNANRGKPITWSAIHNLFKRIKKEMGIKGSFTPYVTRRTTLTEMGKVLTPHELKTFAGHSSIRTSDYYVRIKQEDVDKKLQQKRGLIEEEEEERMKESALKPQKCIRCATKNPVGAKFCNKCGMVMDKKTAVSLTDAREALDKITEITLDKEGKFDNDSVKKVIKQLIKEAILEI